MPLLEKVIVATRAPAGIGQVAASSTAAGTGLPLLHPTSRAIACGHLAN